VNFCRENHPDIPHSRAAARSRSRPCRAFSRSLPKKVSGNLLLCVKSLAHTSAGFQTPFLGSNGYSGFLRSRECRKSDEPAQDDLDLWSVGWVGGPAPLRGTLNDSTNSSEGARREGRRLYPSWKSRSRRSRQHGDRPAAVVRRGDSTCAFSFRRRPSRRFRMALEDHESRGP